MNHTALVNSQLKLASVCNSKLVSGFRVSDKAFLEKLNVGFEPVFFLCRIRRNFIFLSVSGLIRTPINHVQFVSLSL